MHISLIALILGLSYSLESLAALEGDFIAKTPCPATTSIKKAKADGIQVQAGQRYPALGLNKPNGDYVQVRILVGDKTETRWVQLSCGEWLSDAKAIDLPPAVASQKSGQYLLAISWQAAFCEGRPNQAECGTQTPNRYDATHFTLHGLWPQPRGNEYCGVTAQDRANDENHHWDALPEPKLSPQTRTALQSAMPGFASNLHRHEWIKHGTCYGSDADTYFRTALALLGQINQSKLRDLVAAHIGDTLAVYQIKEEFERGFGKEAGRAVAVRCSDDRDSRRQMMGEIWINLTGPLREGAGLAGLLDTSEAARSTCDRAVVDPVGQN